MVLPGQMALQNDLFHPVSQVAHFAEVSVSFFSLGTLFNDTVDFHQELEDSIETLMGFELKFFGIGEFHRLSFLSDPVEGLRLQPSETG